MATLDEKGREVLDQTPVSLPIHFDRPEPIHMRLRRMILEATMDQKAGDETLEDANDFEVEDDPSSYDTGYTEPDLEPVEPVAQPQFTDEEIAAARAAILQMRQQKSQAEPSDAGGAAGVSSPAAAPAEPRPGAGPGKQE